MIRWIRYDKLSNVYGVGEIIKSTPDDAQVPLTLIKLHEIINSSRIK